jgi:hypothetical protein
MIRFESVRGSKLRGCLLDAMRLLSKRKIREAQEDERFNLLAPDAATQGAIVVSRRMGCKRLGLA